MGGQRRDTMEKVIVRIGKIGKGSAHSPTFDRRTHEDVLWLKLTLEISYKRAQKLLNQMGNGSEATGSSDYVTVSLDYRQLARYTAKRQVEGLNQYWKYPLVLEHIEEQEPPAEKPPVELRPGFRKTPGDLE
jgi:hypothetical protein